jgi:hypothetical protein
MKAAVRDVGATIQRGERVLPFERKEVTTIINVKRGYRSYQAFLELT